MSSASVEKGTDVVNAWGLFEVAGRSGCAVLCGSLEALRRLGRGAMPSTAWGAGGDRGRRRRRRRRRCSGSGFGRWKEAGRPVYGPPRAGHRGGVCMRTGQRANPGGRRSGVPGPGAGAAPASRAPPGYALGLVRLNRGTSRLRACRQRRSRARTSFPGLRRVSPPSIGVHARPGERRGGTSLYYRCSLRGRRFGRRLGKGPRPEVQTAAITVSDKMS